MDIRLRGNTVGGMVPRMAATEDGDARTVTAFHEAGHAVAVVMRGGSIRSVTLSDYQHGEGLTLMTHDVYDLAFITWAGPWAEARYQWGDRDEDAKDEEGDTFGDYVTGVFLHQIGDFEALEADPWHRQQREAGADPEAVWYEEMGAVWGAVHAVAQFLLFDITVTDQLVRGLVDANLARHPCVRFIGQG